MFVVQSIWAHMPINEFIVYLMVHDSMIKELLLRGEGSSFQDADISFLDFLNQ